MPTLRKVDPLDLPTLRRSLRGFRWIELRVQAQALDPILLRDHSGSALRGAFGHALHQLACRIPGGCDKNCQQPWHCTYGYLFETPPPANAQRMRRYPAVPHPLVILPPTHRGWVARGEYFSFGISLIGRAIDLLPQVVVALNGAGERGLGLKRSRFRIIAIHDRNASSQPPRPLYRLGDTSLRRTIKPRDAATLSLPPGDTVVRVLFRSPLCLRVNNRYLRDEVPFRALAGSALRRLTNLAHFHCDLQLEMDFASLLARADQTPVLHSELRSESWTRRSNRQQREHPMTGISGYADYLQPDPLLLQIIATVARLGIGKHTTFGLGQVQIEPVAPAE
jgi:hypothetical protein